MVKKRLWWLLLVLPVLALLAGCDAAPAPTAQPPATLPNWHPKLPKLPPGCQWVLIQEIGSDSDLHGYSFDWYAPLCVPATANASPQAALASMEQLEQQAEYTFVRVAGGRYGGGVHSSGEEEGGHGSGGEHGGGEGGGGGK